MFLIPNIFALIVFVYLRPHEVFVWLNWLTLTSLLSVVAFAGVLDLRLGHARIRNSPIHGPILALSIVAMLSLAIKSPGNFSEVSIPLSASLFGFLFTALAVQSLRAFEAVAFLLVAITIFLAVLGVDQGLATPVCYEGAARSTPSAIPVTDGRTCATSQECHEGGRADIEYLCERPGHFGTHSIGLRVRFRGFLEDPNELSMALAIGLPLALGFYGASRSKARLVLAIATVIPSFICVIMTQSRSGQLSVLAALGIYFIRRFGWRGALAGALVGLPVLLLGGRSGEEADSSSIERLECWKAALEMWREVPFFGVGRGLFGEHHYLTAHSSFMLSLAELGPLGLLFWSSAIYAAFKVVVRATVNLAGRPEAAQTRAWASALLAAMAGFVVSAFFLSVTFHAILWLFLGVIAGFHEAVRAHDPDWRVRFGWRDLLGVALADIVLVSGTAFYLSAKSV